MPRDPKAAGPPNGLRVGTFSRLRQFSALADGLCANSREFSAARRLLTVSTMQPFPHSYDVQLAAGATGHAVLSGVDLPELLVAAPPEYDGPGGAWSPEHLLIAAVESCLLLTWRARARHAGLAYVSLDVHGRGVVDRTDGVTRFTEIVLHACLVVPPETDRERALKVLERSEQTCLVSASLLTPVRLVPEIIVGVEDASRVVPV